ncbi:MAG TPA: hypothetical protein VFI31_27350 [Pirellulales bacterium]|nr:hypothetical protein [Pirellulales bacterium]
MRVYTVRKSEPNTDREYLAYVDLLQSIGIDVANVPRTPEPGTTSRWLYVWRSKPQAERFARELGERLRDRSWKVHEFDMPDDQLSEERHGPLAPLTILSIPTSDGREFRLESASLERIFSHFPNARVVGKVTLPTQVCEDIESQHVPDWNRVIIPLTGIPGEAVERLGGVRIVATDGTVLHERIPAEVAR